jgi:DNA-binding PadR family transcriptional regulator
VREAKDSCCDMRGFLGFLILFLLSQKSMHGQEIADEIEKRKGLRESGFLKEEKEGKIISYQLTPTGKKALSIAKRRFTKTFLGVFP